MSLGDICQLFGHTRQAHWKQSRAEYREEIDRTALLHEVREIRRDMPRCGVRKMQVLLRERGHACGRDALFDLLRESGLLVHMGRRGTRTTDSRHRFRRWPNLIRGFVPVCMNQLWVSDITYVEVYVRGKRKWMYLSLVTDAYTHEIVGYALHDSLDTDGPLKALRMALGKFPGGSLKGLIHHSDRGTQYCCGEYVSVLLDNGLQISMTENGDPYENAVAERVNGILKTEWLYHERLNSEKQARERIDRIVYLYNNVRPHMSVGNVTPVKARTMRGNPNRLWKSSHGRIAPA